MAGFVQRPHQCRGKVRLVVAGGEPNIVRSAAAERMGAFIEPAMREARQEGERPSFIRLQRELRVYTASPMGVGLDVPYWLRRLEMEVQRVTPTPVSPTVSTE